MKQHSETRFPPVREIATLLNVSTATVHHVYKQLIQEGIIQTGIGRGTFLASSSSTPTTRKNYCFALSTAWGEPGSGTLISPWARLVGSAFFSAVSRHQQRITLLPQSSLQDSPENQLKHLIQESNEVDGLLLGVNSKIQNFRDQLIDAYESKGKPVISIYPQNAFSHSRNFIITDFFAHSSHMGNVWYRSGRRKIVFLSLDGTLSRNVSDAYRYFGLQHGVSLAGGNCSECVMHWTTNNTHLRNGYDTVKSKIQETGIMPDAIYCSGDYLALGAIQALQELGVAIPSQVSITGSTGFDLTGTIRPEMTRLIQDYDALADRALNMMIHRIENQCQPIPAEFIAPKWHIGDSTTEQENQYLQEILTPASSAAEINKDQSKLD